MINWIASHIGDLLVGGILITIVFFVIKSLIKQRKLGGCAGCSFGCPSNNFSTDELALEELKKVLDQQPWPRS